MATRFIIWGFALLAACKPLDEPGTLVPATVNENPLLPSLLIQVAGKNRSVHLQTYGDPARPVLLVLHGSYTDIRPYRNICEALAGGYHVVIWDQRGCGLSERIPANEFTLETALEEIRSVKAVFSPQHKITLLGQSWGGGLAAYYTARYPEDIQQLVLIEPMPLTGSDMMELYKSIVDFDFFNTAWNNLAAHSETLSPASHARIDYRAAMILRSGMTANYHCDPKNPPAWPIHRVGGLIEAARNLRLGNPMTGFTYDFVQGLEAFPDSALVLGGSCSSLGFTMQKRFTEPHFQQARVVEIPNAGHRMTIEQPEAVMNALKTFLTHL